jgi:hypothetical protein
VLRLASEHAPYHRCVNRCYTLGTKVRNELKQPEEEDLTMYFFRQPGRLSVWVSPFRSTVRVARRVFLREAARPL